MCLSHWHQVPRRIRSEVKASWREYRHAKHGSQARRDAIRRYAAAARAAIAAITEPGGPEAPNTKRMEESHAVAE